MMPYWCPPTNHAGADALGGARPPISLARGRRGTARRGKCLDSPATFWAIRGMSISAPWIYQSSSPTLPDSLICHLKVHKAQRTWTTARTLQNPCYWLASKRGGTLGHGLDDGIWEIGCSVNLRPVASALSVNPKVHAPRRRCTTNRAFRGLPLAQQPFTSHTAV